jgi:PAS domain S-box-containing protein
MGMSVDDRVLLERLKLLADTLPSMLAYWDRSLTCQFANQAYARWFGFDPVTLVGSSMQDLVGPEDFASDEPYARGALAGHEQTFERVVPGPDEVLRHSLTKYLPHVVDGEVQGFVAMVTEISEFRRVESALREHVARLDAEVHRRHSVEDLLTQSQAGLSVTLASIDAGYIATDRQGRVLTMNSVSERLTGWALAQARGEPLWEVLDREGRPAEVLDRNPVDLVVERGITVDDTHRVVIVSRQGARTPVEVKAALIQGPDGGVQGVAIVLRDRSHQIQAEIDSNRLASIVESSSDAIISKTLDGTIQSWNAAAERLFGYRADEAVGRSILLLIPEDRNDEELRIVAELSRGAVVPPFDTQRRTRDGRLIDVSITVSPLRDSRGRIVGASKIVRDISDRIRSEAVRARAQQLETENRRILEASRVKSQFLANMSHELRTPLNAIIGFAELIQMGRVPPDSPKMERFVGHIASSGRHLLQLINDVLDLSKVEAGKFDFFPEPLDLPVLVSEVCDTLRTHAERKAITITTHVDAAVRHVELDPVRLKQVLYNYLSNAIKFTPERGRVAVRIVPQGPDHWRLEVEDSGIGIAPSQIRYLFTEFHQIDASYSKAHQGTGLGLALTKRLVQAQEGIVGVASTPGEGSTFHAVLKRVHGASATLPPAVPAQGKDSDGAHLLVVEDDREVRTRILNGLAGCGLALSGAATGQQASDMSTQAFFDALTLDLHLPDEHSLGLLARMRGRDPDNASPVIGLTAASGAGLVASFAIADILAKPIRVDELARAMTRIADQVPGSRRVMVIDDSQADRDLMSATLTAVGMEAVCFDSGAAAVAAFESVRPAAVVLDLVMPAMDGFAVLSLLQRLPAARQVPVYVWTGMALTEDEYRQLALSARDIVAKGGADLTEMLERLRQWRPQPLPTSASG